MDGSYYLKILFHHEFYYINDNQNFIPLYAFYCGLITYISICYHLYQTHFLISCNITNINRNHLNDDHPIRKILYPIEFNTIGAMKNGLLSLIINNSNSLFYNIFNFTDKGIMDLLIDFNGYYNYDHFNDITDRFMEKLDLKDEQLNYIPFKTYNKWYTIIQKFSNDFVDELERQNKLSELLKWSNLIYPNNDLSLNKKIKMIITCLYFTQIRHKMMSNDGISYYAVKYLRTLKYKQNNYYFTLDNQTNSLVSLLGTKLELPNMLINLSFLINDNDELKKIYNQFYNDIQYLENNFDDNDIPLIKPSLVGISTGV